MAYIVAAAVYAKLGRHCDSSAKEEEGIEDVEREWDWCAGHDSGECARDEEEEGQHCEDCDEHVVVDDGWVAGVGIGDDVADQRHGEECPKKLSSCQKLVLAAVIGGLSYL